MSRPAEYFWHFIISALKCAERVEMNRHQPPCLPGRLDSMIATVHSVVRGQEAVIHPGR